MHRELQEPTNIFFYQRVLESDMKTVMKYSFKKGCRGVSVRLCVRAVKLSQASKRRGGGGGRRDIMAGSGSKM